MTEDMTEGMSESSTERAAEQLARDAAPGPDPSGSRGLDKDEPEASTVDSGGGPTEKDVPDTDG